MRIQVTERPLVWVNSVTAWWAASDQKDSVAVWTFTWSRMWTTSTKLSVTNQLAHTDCSPKSKEVIQAFPSSVLLLSRCLPSKCFFFSKCDHEQKCPREKVLFNCLHCFFGSSETSFGTFGLEFKDDVIVLPVFQFTVAKDFYVIYFI